MVEIYQTSKSNVSEHIKHIFEDGELDKDVVVRTFRITTQHGAIEGKTQSRDVAHYNLDMVIALGYRVQSQVATRFRRWATQRLHEYIQKGFAMDDERLKQGGNRYFRELLQRIRDIRSNERNFYQQEFLDYKILLQKELKFMFEARTHRILRCKIKQGHEV